MKTLTTEERKALIYAVQEVRDLPHVVLRSKHLTVDENLIPDNHLAELNQKLSLAFLTAAERNTEKILQDCVAQHPELTEAVKAFGTLQDDKDFQGWRFGGSARMQLAAQLFAQAIDQGKVSFTSEDLAQVKVETLALYQEQEKELER